LRIRPRLFSVADYDSIDVLQRLLRPVGSMRTSSDYGDPKRPVAIGEGIGGTRKSREER